MQVNISARMRQDFLKMIQSEENKQVNRLGKEMAQLKVVHENQPFLPLFDTLPLANGSAAVSLSNGAMGAAGKLPSQHESDVRHSVVSLESRFSRGDKGNAMIRQLTALEKELVALIGKDIFPRWKKKEEEVDKFLRDEPHDIIGV